MKTIFAFIKAFPAIVVIVERLIDAWYASNDRKAEEKLKKAQVKRRKIIDEMNKLVRDTELLPEERDEIYKNTVNKLFDLRSRV